MKKIAIFTSGDGRCVERLVSLFNQGAEIRVDLVITDRGDNRLVEQMISRGVNALFLPRVVWQNNPSEVLKLLGDNDISLLALDDFNGMLPREIEERYEGKIVRLTSQEEAPKEIVVALEGNEANVVSQSSEAGDAKPECMPEIPKSVDEEWADTLKIKFDPNKVAQTPPPIPGVDNPTPPHSHSFTTSQPYNSTASQPCNSPTPQPFQEPMPSTYLIWSILSTVLCCTIPGIVAIVFSSQVSSKYYSGDLEGAKRASRNAEIWIIVSFVLGVLTSTLYLPIMLAVNSLK